MASRLGKRLKSGHQKTDSEALEDLSSAFHDFDIDGDGLLDKASFLTAIRMLGVTVPPSELEKIFEVLDEEDTGMIAYDKLKEFMKIGKIPSTILNKVKQTGGGASKKRKSIMFGAGGPLLQNPTFDKQKRISSLLPILTEEKEKESDQKNDVSMDKNRVKMIQRAVIVIKKAAMKNISRDEVIEFLADKNMDIRDIEFAYNKAQEQVMSPDERIKYLSDLSAARLTEINQQKNLNDYLSSQISTQSQEIQILREILKICTDKLVKIAPNKSQQIIEKLAAEELTSRIQQVTKDVVNAEQEKDNQAIIVHKRDLQTLQVISDCVTDKQHFHAFLYFHQLESVIRDSMPQLQEFLNEYEFPDEDIDADADDD